MTHFSDTRTARISDNFAATESIFRRSTDAPAVYSVAVGSAFSLARQIALAEVNNGTLDEDVVLEICDHLFNVLNATISKDFQPVLVKVVKLLHDALLADSD